MLVLCWCFVGAGAGENMQPFRLRWVFYGDWCCRALPCLALLQPVDTDVHAVGVELAADLQPIRVLFSQQNVGCFQGFLL